MTGFANSDLYKIGIDEESGNNEPYLKEIRDKLDMLIYTMANVHVKEFVFTTWDQFNTDWEAWVGAAGNADLLLVGDWISVLSADGVTSYIIQKYR